MHPSGCFSNTQIRILSSVVEHFTRSEYVTGSIPVVSRDRKNDRLEGGEVAGYENIKDKGFDKRTTEELRVITSKGGKASGEARRRKADFRKTLNMLLTAEIDNEEWKPVLEALGVECTLESALLMAQIKEAMAGNTKAATFVAKYSGQSPDPDENRRNREADTELKQARKQAVTGENESDEAIDRLDSILEELRNNAVKQETE